MSDKEEVVRPGSGLRLAYLNPTAGGMIFAGENGGTGCPALPSGKNRSLGAARTSEMQARMQAGMLALHLKAYILDYPRWK